MTSTLNRLQESLSSAASAATSKFNDVTTTNEKTIEMWPNTVDAAKKSNRMTSDAGVKIHDTDHWLKAQDPQGRQGPSLLEDHLAREKIHRFDHERIPERVVHARGTGAHGYFKLTQPIPELSSAGILNDTSRHTPMFVRFSTVLGSKGSADTVRDVRGFALKFYTEEGNWDIVGNNIPVFFIQDAIKFPDVIHAGKPEPHNEMPQAQSAHNNFWDFQGLHPEATHMFTWTMSDRAIPRSYRMMQGFGVNTFTLINKEGEVNFIKFVWTPAELGVHSLVWDEALKLAGQLPDFHRKDLMDAIDAGVYPKWKFGIQVVSPADQDKFDFDILDATKLWPEDQIPVRYIGEFTLDRNVDEFFAETEQVAFCTSHIVPGIGFSDDPLLQGRNFSYQDTQITRLGVNWEQLPINRPVCPVMNFNRDGAMNTRIHKGTVNYWPNRFEATPDGRSSGDTGCLRDPATPVVGNKNRLLAPKFKEHFSQAELFYNSLSAPEQSHIKAALAFELSHCDDPVVYTRIVERLAVINMDLATSVATAVGVDPPSEPARKFHGRKAPGISQTEFAPSKPTIATRRIAILAADGFDAAALKTIKAALSAAGALPFVIGPRRGPIYADAAAKTGAETPEYHFDAARSTMFDAVIVAPGAASALTLKSNGRAVHWVREAFGHLKAIAALDDGVAFVQEACVLPGIELALEKGAGKVVESYGVVTAWSGAADVGTASAGWLGEFVKVVGMHRCWARETDGLAAKVAF
ncbi:catalase-like domain-containing protein [Geopyxis carbonaria]|nr:catalase-like domain-containing protein [Geopyxis carbonaria]